MKCEHMLLNNYLKINNKSWKANLKWLISNVIQIDSTEQYPTEFTHITNTNSLKWIWYCRSILLWILLTEYMFQRSTKPMKVSNNFNILFKIILKLQ